MTTHDDIKWKIANVKGFAERNPHLVQRRSVSTGNTEVRGDKADGLGALPIFQEPKENSRGSKDFKAAQLHRSKAQEADGRTGGRYHVSIVFMVSDRRKRDAFGMLETVADALVRAVRRFNSGNPMRNVGD